MQYMVLVPEYHLTEVSVEADSEEEAKELVADGDGMYGLSYYRHPIDAEDWEIYDADSKAWTDRERELRETSDGY